MSSTQADLTIAIEAAQQWAIHDPDPVTRGQIDAMVDEGHSSLVELFDGRLAFGTAGLRAEVGPGPNRMNALVVRQTTTAVVRWLQADTGRSNKPDHPNPRVVIGFDARHNSRSFADHAAAAIQAAGALPLLATGYAPTPVFAHALLAEDADAAIVITASHNPATDNGYKLYLGDGLQLVDPADSEIARLIDEMVDHWHLFGPQIDDTYMRRDDIERRPIERWITGHNTSAVSALFTDEREVAIAYTPMHGVGGVSVIDVFRSAGFSDPLIVEEQFEPDPDFPTVAFPNPEEPGAFDLVVSLAEAEGADAAFANDPDADRLAIAVPNRATGTFVALSGNELGILLADHVLRHTTGLDRIVARSVVSSRQLDALAAAAGVRCDVTLTGFKWVARPIVSEPGLRYVFGYEEAIGYCIGDQVRDKDGVTAALVAAEMLAGLRAQGRTVWDRLDEIATEHGVFADQPISVRFDDEPQRVTELMAGIVDHPPESLGGIAVAAAGPVGLGELPPSSGLHLLTEDDTQVIIRPSGTEPKIKAYIEVIERDVSLGLPVARDRSSARLNAISADIAELLQLR